MKKKFKIRISVVKTPRLRGEIVVRDSENDRRPVIHSLATWSWTCETHYPSTHQRKILKISGLAIDLVKKEVHPNYVLIFQNKNLCPWKLSFDVFVNELKALKNSLDRNFQIQSVEVQALTFKIKKYK